MASSSLHRPPRFPHAWVVWFTLAHVVALVLGWWYSWLAGVALFVAAHMTLAWATLWPRSRWLAPVLARLPTTQRVVWLTIDDGPSDDTPAMLDLLDAHDAKATFFLVGERAQRRPRLVAEIVRRGHDIGNHSQSHPSAWFWALPPRRMRAEIDTAQAVLTRIAGRRPRWFRAVVGMSNPFVAAALKRHDLTRVAWCARGFDAVQADPALVVARIESGLRPGAIVLLHEGARHGRNVETLELVLARLQVLEYRAVLPTRFD